MLVKSKERIKKTGEIFTPSHIVDEMLALLPAGILEDPKMTFLDPTCGNGNILVRILERRIELGLDPIESCSSLYGIDLMQDNIDEATVRLLALAPTAKINLKQADFFEVDWNSSWESIGAPDVNDELF